jgi:LPXTG-motif cell wall-anchored protein
VLPVTGADTGTIVVVGTAFALLGGALVIVSRRRRLEYGR